MLAITVWRWRRAGVAMHRVRSPPLSSPAHAGDPVRRGFSVQSLTSLEYLDHPHARVMTIEYDFAFSRHEMPESCVSFHPPREQRAQGRPDARCTRGLVCNCTEKCAHEHTGPAENTRPSLRNGFTAYIVVVLVRRALLPPSLRWNEPVQLDASFGRRTTRFCRPHQPRSSS